MLPALFCFYNLLLEVCDDAMETQAEGDEEAGQPEDGLSGRKPKGTAGTFAGHRQPKKEPWASQFRHMASEFNSIKDHFSSGYSDQGAFMVFYKNGLQAGEDMGNAGKLYLAKIHDKATAEERGLDDAETRETEELGKSATAPESEQL